MHRIDENLTKVSSRIKQAAISCGRSPETVQLIAVSKTQPVEAIQIAHAWGQRRFGENYVQEALEKQACLARFKDIEWHFIGPVQSNKTRALAENFAWIHSIDREKIAQRLNAQRPAHLPPLNICIQVNIDDEVTKSGVNLNELPLLVHAINLLPRLVLRGLMVIPAATHTPEEQRAAFMKLRTALARLNASGLALDQLSMGMSNDLEIAVTEGATLVRIGTDIFGAREPSHLAGLAY